jgi:hypothetical protein
MKIERSLRETLTSVAERLSPAPDAWESVVRELDGDVHVSVARRAVIVGVAAVIALAGFGVAIAAFRPAAPDATRAASQPVGSTSTLALSWPPDASSSSLAARDGFAWVSGTGGATLIGPEGVVGDLPFEQGPFGLSASSTGTWAAGFEPGTGSYVARFDPSSVGPNLTIPLGPFAAHSLLATNDSVFVFGQDAGEADGDLGTVVKFDAGTGSELATANLGSLVVGTTHPTVVASSQDAGELWILVANIAQGATVSTTLIELNADDLHEESTRNVQGGSDMVAAFGGVWLPGLDGPLRLDPSTGHATGVNVPDNRAIPVAATADGVWFMGGSDEQARLYFVPVNQDGVATGTIREVDVEREPIWGSVEATYDGSGRIWMLYEDGHVQDVVVGSV